MHAFFEAESSEALQAALAEIERLDVLEHLTGWEQFKTWQRLELPVPLTHPRVPGSEIRWVPIPPASSWPKEAGIDGKPRIARLVSAMLRLGRRHLEVKVGERPGSELLQRSLDRYVAAAHGVDVPSFEPREWEPWEPYYDEAEELRALSCRWDADAVLVELSDGRWFRLDDEVSPVDAPIDDWCFLEALERSLLQNQDGIHLLMEVLDYPVVSEPSQDRRWLWATDKHGNGAIYDTRDGLVAASAPFLPDEPTRILHRDGTLTHVPTIDAIDAIEDEEAAEQADAEREEMLEALYASLPEQASALSVVHQSDAPARIEGLYRGVFSTGLMIAFAYDAAAFNAQGDRIALVDANTLLVVRLGETPTIERELTWQADNAVR